MIKESDLFTPVKTYLEHQGYRVSGEVKNCDLVARRDEELVIVELKRNLSVNLLVQAARRKDIAESVYVAVPSPSGRHYPRDFGGVKNLLRRLEVGLILVHFMKTKTKIEIALHPLPFKQRKARKKRAAILREIDGRYAEFDLGGSPSSVERITSYKQEALRIASLLGERQSASPKELRAAGCGPKTQTILSRNVYGWFLRVERGVYSLSDAGYQALDRYSRIIDEVNRKG